MKEPEVQPRHRIVIAREAQVQEPEHVLVHEIEPEKAVILAGAAVHRPVEVRRIPNGGEDVPRRCNRQRDRRAAKRVEAPPYARVRKLFCKRQVQSGGGHRKDGGDQSFEQQARSNRRRENRRPYSRPALLLIERAQEGPHRERNGQRQHDIGNENAREQKQAGAGGERKARVKSCPVRKGPARHSRHKPAQQDGGQRNRNPRDPVVNAKQLEADGDHPVFERRFFEVLDSVQPGGDPIARLQHIAGDLRLNGVDVVH